MLNLTTHTNIHLSTPYIDDLFTMICNIGAGYNDERPLYS